MLAERKAIKQRGPSMIAAATTESTGDTREDAIAELDTRVSLREGHNSPMSPLHSLTQSNSLEVTVAQESIAGAKATNDDSMGIHIPDDPNLLTHKGIAAVIADGVSAADHGREAAETCVQTFLGDYVGTPESWTVKTSGKKVLTALNNWLYGQGAGLHDAHSGFVSTLSILILKSRTAHLFHVGDTRIYVFRNGALRQLTRDHATPVARGKTYLSRAMGLDTSVDVDYRAVPVEVGDIWVLTSDGLHSYVASEGLTSVLSSGADLPGMCADLIARAQRANSPDNITCQLLRIEHLPDASAAEYINHLTELPFPPQKLSIGDVLDGFEVLREIHTSSRSQLFLVKDTRTSDQLVMKTPSVNFEDDPAYIERFVLEQWIGARTQSLHLARSAEPPEDRSCLYHLQEYIDGETLWEWIQRHKKRAEVPVVSEVVGVIGQVVKGVMALHRKEIFHQDIKPGNVLLGKDGVVKLVDYGSCFVAGVDEIAAPIVRDKILGTVSYAAPEYSLGLKPGPNADLYSVGCLAYEMMTLRHPYGAAGESVRTPEDFKNLVYSPAYLHNPNIPVWIDGALERAVKVDAGERYAELSEFITDLEKPNPDFLQRRSLPIIERNSKSFWQGLALLLLLTQAITLALLLR